MAHADYNCCACCDRKLAYAGFSVTTKEEICSGCLRALHDKKLNIWSVNDLIQWIESEDSKTVNSVLESIGFRFCYYSNPVDSLVCDKMDSVSDLELG